MKKQNPENELERLKKEKAALQVQSGLLENFVTLARSAANEGGLAGILRQTLKVSTELTGAEKGSLFLLDENGAATDSILTRADTTENQQSRIIGTVFDKGLAGWVRRHRRVGLIGDTAEDDRGLDLPDQPYRVGSALYMALFRSLIRAYINGGHEPPLIVGCRGIRQKLAPTGPVVGMLPKIQFTKKQARIDAGQTLIGYTDGVTEALAPDNRLFTKQRFLSLLEKPAASAAGLIEQIKTQLDRHMGNAAQFDDITMIAVHRLEN